MLIGTGHVFRLEDTVLGAIRHYRPQAVGVELDRGRLEGLLARERGEAPEAAGGFVHRKLQRFQESLASSYGTKAGGEMVAAVRGARELGARLLLLDVAVDDLVRRVVKELTWRERARLVAQFTAGMARLGWARLRPGPKDGERDPSRDAVEAEIRRYQEDPEATMGKLATDFPTIHRIVIAERDERMARHLRSAVRQGLSVVAVVGDGHLVGMLPMLADLHPVVHRLADVRAGRIPQAPPQSLATGSTESVSFRVTSAAPPPEL
ncbi:MAG TPA: TraB domain-containing protein [Candidatus Thermoplasmatota archaeon]|nr:TraB domain-containing protein [Candidatus Thermoplasmatota archaeon]